MKVVQQQWFSGNQSTTSVSNMLSCTRRVKAFSLSFNQIFVQKIRIFSALFVCFQNSVICVVRVKKCIIKRGGIDQSSGFLESCSSQLVFYSPLAEGNRNNHKDIPISFLWFHQCIFLFWGQRFQRKTATPEFSMDVADEPLRC